MVEMGEMNRSIVVVINPSGSVGCGFRDVIRALSRL
jgi:hypothetical protein